MELVHVLGFGALEDSSSGKSEDDIPVHHRNIPSQMRRRVYVWNCSSGKAKCRSLVQSQVYQTVEINQIGLTTTSVKFYDMHFISCRNRLVQ